MKHKSGLVVALVFCMGWACSPDVYGGLRPSTVARKSCQQLLGPANSSQDSLVTNLSNSAQTYLSLVSIGLQNVAVERAELIREMGFVLNSQHPANPFLNLKDTLARALLVKVEPLLPGLTGEWKAIQHQLTETMEGVTRTQNDKQMDRESTRFVRGPKLVRVPIADGLIEGSGNFKNSTGLLRYDGMSKSEIYFATTVPLENAVTKRFRLSKSDLSFAEIPVVPGDGEIALRRYLDLGRLHALDVGSETASWRDFWMEWIERDSGKVEVSIFKGIKGFDPARSILLFDYTDFDVRWERMVDLVTVLDTKTATGDAFVFMHRNRNQEIVQLVEIDRESFVAKPIRVSGGPGRYRPGNWGLFKNFQGDVLLQFHTNGLREVALWMYDPANASFVLQFHEVIPSNFEEASGIRVDYEAKSLIGWTAPGALFVFPNVDMSVGAVSP